MDEDAKRRKTFAKTMTRLIQEAESNGLGAPITGNVGEDCLGYITDPGGRLFRLHKCEKTDRDVGPGTYNTNISSFEKKSGKTIGIIPKVHQKKEKQPGFYDTTQKSTKILHALPPRQSQVNPFQRHYQRSDYSIPVSTKEKERTTQPQRWHPQTKFIQNRGSYQFNSTQQRDPFNLKHIEPSPPPKKPSFQPLYYDTENYDLPFNNQQQRDTRSAVFKSKTNRVVFEKKVKGKSPDPTTYTLPDTIGRCNGYDFADLFPEGEVIPEEELPGPGQYDIDPKPPGSKKSIKPKDFTLSYPRNMKEPEPLPPGPCEFQKYESPLMNTRPSTIFSRHLTANDEWTRSYSVAPGPGHYNLSTDPSKTHTPGYQYHRSKSQLSNAEYLF